MLSDSDSDNDSSSSSSSDSSSSNNSASSSSSSSSSLIKNESKSKSKSNKKKKDKEDKDDIHQLTINTHYAKAFQIRKEREELANLKEKYDSDQNSNSSAFSDIDSESSYSTEDSTGFDLTPQVDAAILRTLARIKKKDPGIYDGAVGVFDEEQQKIATTTFNNNNNTKKSSSKTKPLHIKQHLLNSTLNPPSRSPSPPPQATPKTKTHVEEQEELRREVVSAFHRDGGSMRKKNGLDEDEDEDGDEGDEFLIPRTKTKDEIEEEEEAYRRFLEREVGVEDLDVVGRFADVDADADAGFETDSEEADNGINGVRGGGVKVEEAKKKKKRKDNEKISKADGDNVNVNVNVNGDEKNKNKNKNKSTKMKKSKELEDNEFLMNYILTRGWIDKSTRRVPTYGDIVGVESNSNSNSNSKSKSVSKSKKPKKGVEKDDDEDEREEQDDLDEEEFDEIADTFENSYNFRFEEPDASTIPLHPRHLASTVRREDTKRKDARSRRKERKEEKMMKKREEVRRMKALKMKEVLRRLERIGREGGVGVDEDALKELDLDAEWDAEEHDRQMRAIYDENDPDSIRNDQDEDADTEKPTWNDDIDISDIVPSLPAPTDVNKKKKKKKKSKEKGDEDGMGVDFDDMDADVVDWKLARARDEEEEWDGSEEMRKRKLDEYMDDLYGLEFNDMIGDVPTRFKYTPVQPQTYGLSAVDILLTDDKDLNEYRSIKKYAPYLDEREGKKGRVRWEKLKEVKERVRERVRESGMISNRDGEEMRKKRKGKKERLKEKSLLENEEQPNKKLKLV